MNRAKRIHSRSKSSLFIMEMILSVLFFALACSICLQVAFMSYQTRHEARVLNHIQELSVTCSEILEGWTGTNADYALLLQEVGLLPVIEPVQKYEGEGSPCGLISLYFDRTFTPCPAEDAFWHLHLRLFREDYQKSLRAVLFEKQEDGAYAETELSFGTAFPTGRKEGRP